MAAFRWGDVQSVILTNTVAQEGTTVSFPLTKQLVSANWRVPMSWNVLLFCQPFVNSAEGGTFTVNWLFSLGGGQASTTSIPLFTMGPFGRGPTNNALLQQQQLVPSSNLQITAQIITQFATASQSSAYVGAFVAPNNAEPFGEIESRGLLEGYRRHIHALLTSILTGKPIPFDPQAFEPDADAEGVMRWMEMGGPHEDPLRYRGR